MKGDAEIEYSQYPQVPVRPNFVLHLHLMQRDMGMKENFTREVHYSGFVQG